MGRFFGEFDFDRLLATSSYVASYIAPASTECVYFIEIFYYKFIYRRIFLSAL